MLAIAVVMVIALAVAVVVFGGRGEPAAATIQSCLAVPPVAAEGCYEEVWGDEFDGDRLDPAKWSTAEPWVQPPGEINEAALSPIDGGDVVEVTDGSLRLSVAEETARVDGTTLRYAAGSITSREQFDEITDGYVAARMRLPDGAGLWTAFWLLGNGTGDDGWPGTGEIDIVEVVNNGTDDGSAFQTAHWLGDGEHQMRAVQTHVDDRLDGDWHTFGVLRTGGRLAFFVDDEHVATMYPGDASEAGSPLPASPLLTAPMHVRINITAGGDWATNPNEAIAPGTLVVDWVRYWAPA